LNSTLERAIGRWLRRVRAGDHHLACNDPGIGDTPADILLTSPAFADGAAIPDRHAGVGLGENLSPPLEWSGVPAWTAELVLVMQDADAPLSRPLRGHGPRRYVFQIFALASRLRVSPRADQCATKSGMSAFVLAHGKLTGTYEYP
jgi:phosphatidylethanolamine-binding protein (PEBP) family uncharacterized protein